MIICFSVFIFFIKRGWGCALLLQRCASILVGQILRFKLNGSAVVSEAPLWKWLSPSPSICRFFSGCCFQVWLCDCGNTANGPNHSSRGHNVVAVTFQGVSSSPFNSLGEKCTHQRGLKDVQSKWCHQFCQTSQKLLQQNSVTQSEN